MEMSEFHVKEEHIQIAMRTVKNKKENRFLTREEAIKVNQLFIYWAKLEYGEYKRKIAEQGDSVQK